MSATRAAGILFVLMAIFLSGCSDSAVPSAKEGTTLEHDREVVEGPAPTVDGGAAQEDTVEATDSSVPVENEGTNILRERDVADGSVLADDDRILTAISSGDLHTCGLRGDGTAVCWGSNFYGQSTPPENERFMAISSGDKHTCALSLDGTPVCWGANPEITHWNDWTFYKGLVTPPENERFKEIISNGSHSCGLRENGTVACWGEFNFKKWGQPPDYDRFTKISLGYRFTCAIRIDGKVGCWGEDIEYQILDLPSATVRVDSLSSREGHVCAILDDASIYCWDIAAHSHRGERLPPKGRVFKEISMANEYGCALRPNGTVVCWGLMAYDLYAAVNGGSFYGDDFGQNVPPSGETFTSISTGRLHACGLREDGTPVCWGIGSSRTKDGPFSAIASGQFRTCSIDPQGSARCWGPRGVPIDAEKVAQLSDGGGSLVTPTIGLRGDGTFIRLIDWPKSDAQYLPNDPPEDYKFKTISGEYYYVCGIREDGTAYCWPGHDYEEGWQFGEGKFIEISTSPGFGRHVCGLKEDGAIVCQLLSRKPRRDFELPTPPEGKSFTAISSGGSYACALDREGKAFCWGNNSPNRTSPPEGELFMAISSGGAHTCGLRKDGTPLCWGDYRYNAISAPEDEKFVALSSGYYHTCGRREDGTVACWGWEDFGQARPPAELAGLANEIQ